MVTGTKTKTNRSTKAKASIVDAPRVTRAKANDAQPVMIQRPDIRKMDVTIQGTTPLITSNPERYIESIPDPSGEGGAGGQKLRDRTPDQQYEDSRYMKDAKTHGFPVSAVKRAMEFAVGMLRSGKATTLSEKRFKAMMHIYTTDGHRLATLKFARVERYDDVARNKAKGNIPIPVTRAMYFEWSMTFIVQFNANVISAQNVLNLLMQAGTVGIGVKRGEVGHSNGLFEVLEEKGKK